MKIYMNHLDFCLNEFNKWNTLDPDFQSWAAIFFFFFLNIIKTKWKLCTKNTVTVETVTLFDF